MRIDDTNDVAEDLGMFQAAMHARPLEVPRPQCSSVLVALDGSNQDAAARAFAAAVAERTGAVVHECVQAETAGSILTEAARHQAGLIVVPVPFGRDMSELRDESLGFVIDMLLQEARCPVLCVREPVNREGIEKALAALVVPVTSADEHGARAVGWAGRLLRRGGDLTLLALGDRDALDETRPLLGAAIEAAALTPAALARAVALELGNLIAAAQRLGNAEGLRVHVTTKIGRVAELTLAEANPELRLIVVGAPKDHQSPLYHHAVDLVLGARSSVLVV